MNVAVLIWCSYKIQIQIFNWQISTGLIQPVNRVASTTASEITFFRKSSFLMYLVVKILQLGHELSSFPQVRYNSGDLNIFSKLTDKHKKQSPGGVLSKDVLKSFANLTEKHLSRSLFFK